MILGIDLGTNSVGWALVDSGEQKILTAGVRVFEAGMEGNMEDGTQTSRNLTRREKRQLRRQHDRRARRMRRILSVLQSAGLMPTADNMAHAIEEIDQRALARLKMSADRQYLAHVVPYRLRAEALDKLLDDFELGRAFYHLAQRRGFLSNKKTAQRDDEEETGKVKSGISELSQKMEDAGARTLGEYFSFVDPEEERIRGRYTGRQMFIDEFKKIMAAQREFGHARLTPELEKKLYQAIFYQRPLKSCLRFVGRCPYEKGKPRAPWYHPLAQRFRVLQTLNHLRLMSPCGEERPLSEEERKTLSDILIRSKFIKIPDAKKAIGLGGKKNAWTFSIEDGGEKSLSGHVTNAKMIEVFGETRWMGMVEAEQLAAIYDVQSYESEAGLKKRGKSRWNLTDEQAERIAATALPDDYTGLSLAALQKIVPLMEQGEEYMTAVTNVYGDTRFDKAREFLPMIKGVGHAEGMMPDLRNPAVERSLTQLRKVINPIIRKFGKPEAIHIELARDVKRSVKEKKRIMKKMRDQQKLRDAAKQELANQFPEFKDHEPKRRDVEKYLLWKECREQCPYSGDHIPLSSLFGDYSEFDIEHIIPYSVSLDDSFTNKTLCRVDINRQEKRNRTPWQAFFEDKERYEAMLARVKNFDSPQQAEKLRRFEMQDTDEFSDFTSRQLNDTSYASKLAKAYLASLYGGTSDADGRQRIVAVSRGITAIVRNYYRLNRILGEGDRKTRSDHRHHAVDAIVIAITSQGTIQKVSDTAAEFSQKNTRLMYQGDEDYWKGFEHDVRRTVEGIKVTHAVSHKVRGALHEETIYGRIKDSDGNEIKGKAAYRRKLEALSDKDIKQIADDTIREIVVEKLGELGIYDRLTGKLDVKKLSSAFSDKGNYPRMTRSDGTLGPQIKSVRCHKDLTTMDVGNEAHPRPVVSGNNHHVEIVEVADGKGGVKWEGVCVSMFEAYQRKKHHLPIVQRDHGADKRFVFSLACGDIIECKLEDDPSPQLYVMRAVSTLEIGFVPLTTSFQKKELVAKGLYKRKKINPLRLTGARKVTLTPFGEIHYAND